MIAIMISIAQPLTTIYRLSLFPKYTPLYIEGRPMIRKPMPADLDRVKTSECESR